MLNDFTKWQEVFSGSYRATRDQCGRSVAIPEIFPLIANPTNKMLVGCFAQEYGSNWINAGYLYQIIQLPFKSSYSYEHKCLLNKFNFIDLPVIGDFQISFKPMTWLNDITLRISIFTE